MILNARILFMGFSIWGRKKYYQMLHGLVHEKSTSSLSEPLITAMVLKINCSSLEVPSEIK